MKSALQFACLLVVSAVACSTHEDAPDDASDGGRDAGHGSGGGIQQLDRSGFNDVGTTESLDYSTPEFWVCHPDIDPNECNRDLDVTEIRADGSMHVMKHERAVDPDFDCFYVYPTVWLNKTPQMTDFSDTSVVLDAVLNQAARFSSLCRVFAPFYRQSGLSAVGLQAGANKELALQDVRDAFSHYLEHAGKNRKFVLLGHSQGSFILTSLISRDIDDNPDLRARMISALLIGAQPYAPAGERVGGSFKNIAACTEKDQIGCVVAYNSYPSEKPATAGSQFGHVTTSLANEDVDTSGQVFCVAANELAGDSASFSGSYFPQTSSTTTFGTPAAVAGVDTPFVRYPDMFRGKCVQRDGLNYLEIFSQKGADDVREVPIYRSTLLEGIGFGLHVVDYNLPLADLLTVVERQAAAAR